MKRKETWRIFNILTAFILMVNMVPITAIAETVGQAPIVEIKKMTVTEREGDTAKVKLTLKLDHLAKTADEKLLTVMPGTIEDVTLVKGRLEDLKNVRFEIAAKQLPASQSEGQETTIDESNSVTSAASNLLTVGGKKNVVAPATASNQSAKNTGATASTTEAATDQESTEAAATAGDKTAASETVAATLPENQLKVTVQGETQEEVTLEMTLKIPAAEKTVTAIIDDQKVLLELTTESSAEESNSENSGNESETTTQPSDNQKDSTEATVTSTNQRDSQTTSESSESETSANQTMPTRDSSDTTTESKPTTKTKAATKAAAAGRDIQDLLDQYANGGSLISSVTYDPEPVTDPTDFQMNFTFKVPDTVQAQLQPGDTYTFVLPDILKFAGTPPASTTLKDGNGKTYGKATVDQNTGMVTLTMTDEDGNVPEEFDPDNFTPMAGGTLSYHVSVDQQIIKQPGKTTITYPKNYELPPQTIFIQPNTKNAVSKAVTPDKKLNPTTLTWTVDINKTLSTLTNPVLQEHFPAEVTYQSAVVYPVTLDFTGNIATVSTTPLIAGQDYTIDDAGNITFVGEVDQAYRVIYTTAINDDAKPDAGGTTNSIVNNVTWADDLTAEASIQLNYGKTLEKVAPKYHTQTQSYDWTIHYNYGQKIIDTQTPLIDTYSTNMDLDASSIKLHYMTIGSNGKATQGAEVPSTAYTLDTSTPGKLSILFNESIAQNQAINISYTTKVNQLVTENSPADVKVTNTVEQGKVPPSTPGNIPQPQQQVVIKNKPTLDIAQKLSNWVIDINKNGYQLNHANFTDTIDYSDYGYLSTPVYFPAGKPVQGYPQIVDKTTGQELKGALLVDGKYEIGEEDDSQRDYVVNIQSSKENLSGNGQYAYDNFTVTFVNAYAQTNHTFQMFYTLLYNHFEGSDVDIPGELTYTNKIDITWNDKDGNPHHSTDENHFTTTSDEANQGVKFGSYNAITKEITWTVIANYNNIGVASFSMDDPIITDKNSPENSQVYVPGSLTILRGTIDTKGNFSATEQSAYQGNQLGQAYITVQEPSEESNVLHLQIGQKNSDGSGRIPGWSENGTPMTYQIQFKTSLKNLEVSHGTYDNVATTEVGGVTNELSAQVSVKYGGKPLGKSGQYTQATNQIDWKLWINQAQSLLTNPVLTDNPSTNQIVDLSTVKLYLGNVDVDGNLSQGPELVQGKDYFLQLTTDPATGQQQLTVAFSEDYKEAGQSATNTIEKPYLLTYSAKPNLSSATEKVTNNASLKADGTEITNPDTSTTINVTVTNANGSAYGNKGRVTIQKINENGSPLAGAHLQLIRRYTNSLSPDEIIYDVTTDATGKVTFGNLIYSSSAFQYILKEVAAPAGYTISDELVSGKVLTVDKTSTGSGTPIAIVNNRIAVTFYKNGSRTSGNVKLNGGLFILEKATDDGYNAVGQPFAASSNGVLLNDLDVGDYRLRELSPPADDKGPTYLINSEPVLFSVKQLSNGQKKVYLPGAEETPITSVSLNDYLGTAQLQKNSENEKKLAGAIFSVKWAPEGSSDFTEVEPTDGNSFVTDSNGKLTLTDLRPGNYQVTESQAASGYYLNNQVMTFRITGDVDSRPDPVKINNGAPLINYKGSAQFSKVAVDEQGKEKVLADATFALLNDAGQPLDQDGKVVQSLDEAQQVFSDDEGLFTVNGLSPGTTYGLTEVAVPKDYVINDTVLWFTTPLSAPQNTGVTINSADQKLVYKESTPYRNYNWKVYWDKVAQNKLSDDENTAPLGLALYKVYRVEGENTEDIAKNSTIDHGQIETEIDGQQVAVFQSNPLTGRISVFNLTGGTYYYQEIQAPKGYLLDTTKYRFTLPSNLKPANGTEIALSPAVDGETDEEGTQEVPVVIGNQDQIQRVAVRNYQGAAEMQKTLADGETPLADATFGVYQEDGQQVLQEGTPLTVTSDENGRVYAEGLAPGDYYFQETATPENHYIVNTTKVSFTIPTSSSGKPAVVEIKDGNGDPYRLPNYQGAAQLIKLDGEADEKTPLAGAVFEVYTKEGMRVADQQELVSDENGQVTVTDLAPGAYYFQEVNAPAGYVLNERQVNFTIPDSWEGELPLVTEEKGQPLTLTNYQGQARLTKTNEAKEQLAGAVFELTDEVGNVLPGFEALTSQGDGSITVTGLAPGNYRFKERQSPAGYLLNTAELPLFTIPAEATDQPAVVVQSADGTPLTAVNYRGSARLQKTVETTQGTVGLAGAHFKVVDDQTLAPIDGFTDLVSDGQGNVIADGLAPGGYRFMETQAPTGYIMDPTPSESFTIDSEAADKPTVVEVGQFVNFQGTVRVHKTDSEGNPLSGAVFQIWDLSQQPATLVPGYDKLISDENGEVQATGLAPGSYEMREKTPPTGFIANTRTLPFIVATSASQQPVIDLGTFVNFKGEARLLKTDEAGDSLAGAEFRLERLDHGKGRQITTSPLLSDENGEVLLENLAPGEYQLQEAKAPDGYIRSTRTITFTIDSAAARESQLDLGTLVNYQGAVHLRKTNAKHETLGGAVFQLWQVADGNEAVVPGFEKVVSDEKGLLSANGLAPGSYEWRELTPPTGYKVSRKAVGFTIPTASDTAVSLDLGDFINQQQPGKTYPKTGDTIRRTLPLAGLVLIVIAGGLWLYRRKE